jgi:hypothetical protein
LVTIGGAILRFQNFEMSAIFKMAAKARYKKWAVKIQHCPISSKFDMTLTPFITKLKTLGPTRNIFLTFETDQFLFLPM